MLKSSYTNHVEKLWIMKKSINLLFNICRNWTFQPEISKISYAITAREERDSKPLWDRLLEHNKKVKQSIDNKFIEKRMIEYNKETEGWTFEPEFFSKAYRFNQTQKQSLMDAGDVYDRSSMWTMQKNIKIDEHRFR
jgi:hypothetical protein